MTNRNGDTGGWPTNVIAFPRSAAARSGADEERTAQLARLRSKIREVERTAPPEATELPSTWQNTGHEDATQEPARTIEEQLDEAVTMLTRALARSPKSEQECEQLLQQHTELRSEQRMHVLSRLRGYGYLDDARMAQQLIDGKLARKGLGRAAKARELRQRGLGQSTIDDALAADGLRDFEIALKLAEKRATTMRGLEPETARRRLYSYLGRRGFSTGIIAEVVELALDPPNVSGPYFKEV